MSDLLILDGVSRRFSGISALTEVSFAVPTGAVVVLLGSGGAGKSTLFNVITGACRPDTGAIWFEGREITFQRPDRLCAAGIARTFQRPRLFGSLSLTDIVTVGTLLHEPDIAEARQRALELLEDFKLIPWYEQPASCLNLAGLKRLELARALATLPRMLLLDEIFAGLPAEERSDILNGLRNLNRRHHMTMLIAEAEIGDDLAALADRTVSLDHGEVVAVTGDDFSPTEGDGP